MSEQTKTLSANHVLTDIIAGYKSGGSKDNKEKAINSLKTFIEQVANEHAASKSYNVLILHDSSKMLKADANSIYDAVTRFEDTKKPLLLVLYSNGGEIGSAYLIGQLCREYSEGKFVISVPRQAKSAATLLCCAGDEIHMGSLSELGPIDPQIRGLPVLGLKNSIEHIASLVEKTPKSARMFAQYLQYAVEPIDIGYYERVAESAKQYAEKLLASNSGKLPNNVGSIAYDLVYSYKDHSFVIDKNEATNLLGEEIVKINTDEYKFSNAIYTMFSHTERILNIFNYDFSFIGTLGSRPTIREKSN